MCILVCTFYGTKYMYVLLTEALVERKYAALVAAGRQCRYGITKWNDVFLCFEVCIRHHSQKKLIDLDAIMDTIFGVEYWKVCNRRRQLKYKNNFPFTTLRNRYSKLNGRLINNVIALSLTFNCGLVNITFATTGICLIHFIKLYCGQ